MPYEPLLDELLPEELLPEELLPDPLLLWLPEEDPFEEASAAFVF